MEYFLRPGLSFCETSSRLVFLDINQDRYFCLGEKAERALRSYIVNGYADGDSVAQILIEGGILIRAVGYSTISPTANPPIAHRSALDEISKPPRWRWVLRAAVILASTHLRLRNEGLGPTLQHLQRVRQQCVPRTAGNESICEIVGACERLSLVLSPFDQCLPRSVALAHLLARSGHAAELVIGVRLRPFLAHSWVQHGDILLNERVDVARTFTPILVI